MARTDTIEPGSIMRYVGDEHSGMKGDIVRVLAAILDDAGNPTGSYDVQPWIELESRYSWATGDARAEDLVPAPEASAMRYQQKQSTFLLLVPIDPDEQDEH